MRLAAGEPVLGTQARPFRATLLAAGVLCALFAAGHDPAGHPIAWSLLVAIAACAIVQFFLVSWLREVARPGLSEY